MQLEITSESNLLWEKSFMQYSKQKIRGCLKRIACKILHASTFFFFFFKDMMAKMDSKWLEIWACNSGAEE